MAQRKHEAKPGDLIEIFRPVIQHWAVYVGDEEVVHLTSADNKGPSNSGSIISFSSSGSEAVVKRENIWDLIRDCEFRVNNLLDDKYTPRDPNVIVKEACEMVGKKLPYSVTAANCEHFAKELRYGKAESEQGKVAAAVVAGIVVFLLTSAFGPAVATAAAVYFVVSLAL